MKQRISKQKRKLTLTVEFNSNSDQRLTEDEILEIVNSYLVCELSEEVPHDCEVALNKCWLNTEDVDLIDLQVGDEVYWEDPDEGHSSGYGTIIHIGVPEGESIQEDTIISLSLESGSDAEVFLHEIS